MDKVWIYTICYNEAFFVGNFLAGYKEADRIIVYDNESTDNTRELLRRDPRVEIRNYKSENQLNDLLHLKIKEDAWKEANGKAEWVIVVDFDEILNHVTRVDGEVFMDLDFSGLKDYDVVKPYGYNLDSIDAPLFTNDHPFVHSQKGNYNAAYEKMCAIRPNRIREMRYSVGCHTAEPKVYSGQEARIYHGEDWKMLHFKVWNLENNMRKVADYQKRFSEINVKRGWGTQYLYPLDYHRNMFINGASSGKYLFDIEYRK